MRVKRYIVDALPEALNKIRHELGEEAVILNTKPIRFGGWFGLFSKKKFEVVAAVDSFATERNSTIRRGNETARAITAALATAVPPAPAAPTAPLASQSPPVTTNLHAVPQMQENTLLSEMKSMKEMMYKLSAQHGGKKWPAIEKLEARLLQHEIAPSLVERIVQEIGNAWEGQPDELTWSTAKQAARQQLLTILNKNGRQSIQPTTKLVHFVGPTGVGKTTTIAKIAAEQVLKHKRKVGFITADTYRIAAVEQLKTYANILNVPIEVVFSPQDLQRALQELASCDLIFMDTAGRNFRNEMYVSELNSLLAASIDSETYLVLSLTMKYTDMKAITENFMKYKVDKVLFTKYDETANFGTIVNLVDEFSLPLSYISDGQNVPDDICEVNAEHIVSAILEDSNHE